jgi:hypothetical protein
MKKFLIHIIHFLLIGAIPFLILFIGYIVYDPFKVMKHYEGYSYLNLAANRDFISTEMYLKNNKKYKYNSFILGSSRTLAYRPASWTKHLSANSNPFIFDSSRESIFGVYSKLKYLDSKRTKIDNALIILCRDVTFVNFEDEKGFVYIKDPRTSGGSNLEFQFAFLKAYLNPNYFYRFYDYSFTKHYKPYMKGYFQNYLENKKNNFDTITNAIYRFDEEKELSQNPIEYYAKRKKIFYERQGETKDTIQRINAQHIFMLQEIKRILEKNHTNYKIVLSPLYEQIKFNDKDFVILKQLFNKNMYDFSGKNYFTDCAANYYENSHYRPIVGDSILNIIYN